MFIHHFIAVSVSVKTRATLQNKKVNLIDEEMINFLRSQCSERTLPELRRMLAEETKIKERKSIKRWELKQEWLETYEKKFNNADYLKIKTTRKSNQVNDKNRRRQTFQQTFDRPVHRIPKTIHARIRNNTRTERKPKNKK